MRTHLAQSWEAWLLVWVLGGVGMPARAQQATVPQSLCLFTRGGGGPGFRTATGARRRQLEESYRRDSTLEFQSTGEADVRRLRSTWTAELWGVDPASMFTQFSWPDWVNM